VAHEREIYAPSIGDCLREVGFQCSQNGKELGEIVQGGTYYFKVDFCQS
jgi:hypothetical protein